MGIHAAPHAHTMGADMQSSTILRVLHKVALDEGHLPEELNIEADKVYEICASMWACCII